MTLDPLDLDFYERRLNLIRRLWKRRIRRDVWSD